MTVTVVLLVAIAMNNENNNNRPLCPKCGEANPVSRGHVWRCRECDFQFTKRPSTSPYAHLKYERREAN